MSALPNVQNFPLLRLPFVAIQEVCSTWTPFDLINFSLISTKTKRLTKAITKTNKCNKRYVIRSVIDEYPDLGITQSESQFFYEMTSNESENEEFIEYSDEYQTIMKYSENILEGYKEWVGYVLDVLNCEIQEIEFYTDAFPDKNEAIVDWWKSQSNSINSCEIIRAHDSEEIDDVIVAYLLNNLKLSGSLKLEVKLSDNFQATIPKVSDKLEIHHGKWVTLQQLLECDCPSIFIVHSGLTNQELNQFLKSWQSSESNFNLTYIHIEVQNEIVLEEGLNIQTVDDHIQMTRIDGKVAELMIGTRLLRVRVY